MAQLNADEAHRPILGEVKGTAFFDGAIAKEIYNRKYEVYSKRVQR